MDTSSAAKPMRRYSLGEEIANSTSHGVGALLAIAALVLLIVKANVDGGGVRLTAALLMGISLVLEYLFSTLYHALTPETAKKVFRVLDHVGIYLLIAGSYAPYALVTLANDGGMQLARVVWVVAAAGIALECVMRERQPKWLSAALYVALGWLVVARLPQLVALLPTPGFALLLAGGICYTAGAAFYIPKKVPYLHFVFHLLTVAGSVCMVLSVLLFVL